MSKAITNFFTKTKQNFDMAKKFGANMTAGSRIVPSQTAQKDAEYQLRIDAGEIVDGKRNVYLQVNSQAKSPGLKDWVRQNGTHTNLASATFDTTVADPEAESNRVLDELQKDAKDNI